MGTVKDIVQHRYGIAAQRVRVGQAATCGCGTSSACCPDPITSNLYDEAQAGAVPAGAMLASLGCGNPTALAELKEGETVLDLGSGGGIDVLLSARRVGPTGMAYGLDMTDDMLALARENQQKAGLSNVEFLKGDIERIPLPDASVDVVISNCVVNLAVDKERVLTEAFRVLRPGGRLAISDIVLRDENIPDAVRASLEMWVGCVAGALEEREYQRKLTSAGFEAVDIEPTRVYTVADACCVLDDAGIDAAVADQIGGKFMSAFIRARRPAARDCCSTSCCA